MDDLEPVSEETIEELQRLLEEVQTEFKAGTSDPDHFLTISDIEKIWGKLIGDTNVLYSDMFQSMLKTIDEKDLIRKKKENTPSEESS